MLRIPLLTGCGLFDIKLKLGNASASSPRLTQSFEIEIPAENGGIFYVDDKAYPITPNRLFCIKPGQIRKTRSPYRCYYIHVYPDNGEVCQILSAFPDSIAVKDPQQYIRIFRELALAESGGYPYKKFQVAYRFLELIQQLFLEVKSNETKQHFQYGRASRKAVQDATVWIDTHLAEKITLEQLAKEVYLSPIYFRNLFTELMGISPHVYIRSRRMERAKQLLRTTNLSLSEIAEQCGFPSQAYFGKIFKADTGYTPHAFRIMVNNQYP